MKELTIKQIELIRKIKPGLEKLGKKRPHLSVAQAFLGAWRLLWRLFITGPRLIKHVGPHTLPEEVQRPPFGPFM